MRALIPAFATIIVLAAAGVRAEDVPIFVDGPASPPVGQGNCNPTAAPLVVNPNLAVQGFVCRSTDLWGDTNPFRCTLWQYTVNTGGAIHWTMKHQGIMNETMNCFPQTPAFTQQANPGTHAAGNTLYAAQTTEMKPLNGVNEPVTLVYGFDSTNTAGELWTAITVDVKGGVVANPANSQVFIVRGKHYDAKTKAYIKSVEALHAQTGKSQWATNFSVQAEFSPLTFYSGALFFVKEDPTVATGQPSFSVLRISAATGREIKTATGTHAEPCGITTVTLREPKDSDFYGLSRVPINLQVVQFGSDQNGDLSGLFLYGNAGTKTNAADHFIMCRVHHGSATNFGSHEGDVIEYSNKRTVLYEPNGLVGGDMSVFVTYTANGGGSSPGAIEIYNVSSTGGGKLVKTIDRVVKDAENAPAVLYYSPPNQVQTQTPIVTYSKNGQLTGTQTWGFADIWDRPGVYCRFPGGVGLEGNRVFCGGYAYVTGDEAAAVNYDGTIAWKALPGKTPGTRYAPVVVGGSKVVLYTSEAMSTVGYNGQPPPQPPVPVTSGSSGSGSGNTNTDNGKNGPPTAHPIISGPAPPSSGGSGFVALTVILILIALAVVAGIGFYAYKKSKGAAEEATDLREGFASGAASGAHGELRSSPDTGKARRESMQSHDGVNSGGGYGSTN